MGNTISKKDVKTVLSTVSIFLQNEPNLIYLEDPLTIVGDIHGQLNDLKQIIRLGGNPDDTKYLFLGDYVDRGQNSFEVIFSLLALKINLPNSIFLLRGNHETRTMTKEYGFYNEILQKYD